MSTDYDRHARVYDRLIGSRLYNRVVWGTRPAEYVDFAARAVASDDGPLLDVGCGTAVFTAPVYRRASRPITLLDQSQGMLDKARERLAGAEATLVQGDILDLPFEPSGFTTVACHAMLHVLDDPWAGLAALRPQLAPGGSVFASMLVTDRGGLSGPCMRALRKRGELGEPRSAAEFEAAARQVFGDSATVERSGSMAYLTVRFQPK